MQVKIWGAIAVASLTWGTAGVATRAALTSGVGEWTVAAVRAILAALLLGTYLVIRHGRIGRTAAVWRAGLVLGVVNLAVPFVSLTYAYANASAGFLGVVAALIPITTAGLAHWLLPGEKLHLAKVFGLLTALVGVALLVGSGDSGLENGGRPLLAFLLGFGGVLAISYGSIFAKQRAEAYDPIELTGTLFIVGAVILVIAAPIIEGMPSAFTAWQWTLLLYLAIAGSIIPFVTYYWLLKHVTATKASLIGYFVPFIALATGIVLIDEKLRFGIVFGGLVILAGVIFTDRAERVASRV